MPPDNTDDGLRAAVALRREHADMPVLGLSQYVEQSYAAHLLDLGSDIGVGYLLKDRGSAVGEFVDAVVPGGRRCDGRGSRYGRDLGVSRPRGSRSAGARRSCCRTHMK